MSIKLMVDVWSSALEKSEKSVAVKYADFANDDGTGIFPSVGRVAWETGYGERQIQRITKKLTNDGVLTFVGIHPIYNTNEYKMNVEALPKRETWAEYLSNLRGDKLSGGGDIHDEGHRVTSTTDRGVTMSPYPLVNPFLNHQLLMHLFYLEFCDAWATYYPQKPQPRTNNKSLQSKMETRCKDEKFIAHYKDALKRGSTSVFLTKTWHGFDAYWFLENDKNWEKVYNGNYDNPGKRRIVVGQGERVGGAL